METVQSERHCSPVRQKFVVDDGAGNNHAQSSVDELSVLLVFQRGPLSKTKRVKAKVSRRPSRAAHHLHQRGDADNNLKAGQPEEQLDHGPLGDAPVVDGDETGRGAGVEGERVELGDDEAQEAEHGDAAVLDLRFAQELHVHQVRQAQRVERRDFADPAREGGLGVEEGDRLRLGHHRRRRRCAGGRGAGARGAGEGAGEEGGGGGEGEHFGQGFGGEEVWRRGLS